MLMRAPPCAFRCCTATSDPCTTPQKLVSKTRPLVFGRDLLVTSEDADAGVVHPRVDSAETFQLHRSEAAHVVLIARVGRDVRRLADAVQLIGEAPQRLFIAGPV